MSRLFAAALLVAAFLVPSPPAAAAVLLSQGRPATASSVENPDSTPASAAFDGNAGTRWSSQFSDDQWIQVDLGQVSALERVELVWEGAFARAYELQVSTNGTSWTTIHSTTSGAGGTEGIPVSGSGRYVRMRGITRATGYGYSLWEFRVFGPGGGPTDPPAGGAVEVVGGNGDWQLLVGGQPYEIRGLTWGPPIAQAEQWMPGLAAMGANTTRTWGTGADTVTLLDSAQRHGIRVILGFWLLPGGGPGSGGCINYVTDSTYRTNTQNDILNQVRAYQDHPATLMWNVGNESVLGLQNCYSGAELEAQRNAYTSYVNQVARAIHAIDPDHPVTSTDAWTGAWPYYERNAPDLDLLAVNAYQDVCGIAATWEAGGYDRPYIVTEAGPPGEWEVPDDANGVAREPTDIEKADAYRRAWGCVAGHDGVALGATLFHYGLEGDFGGVWFNVIPGGNRRLSYYAIADLWGGSPPANRPPRITAMDVASATGVAAGSQFTVNLAVSDPNGDALNHVWFFNGAYVNGSWGQEFTTATQVAPGQWRLTAPQTVGVWKVVVFVEDGQGNVGVETRSFRVVPPPVAGTNVARGRPAAASSFQTYGDNYSPPQAVDGNVATRWASEWTPTAWYQVDLGAPTSFRNVQLVWEAAYGRSYQIRTSDDGTTWTTVHTVTGGDGGIDTHAVSGRGRYVRLELTERGTSWGYSLYEIGIYQ